MVTEFDVGVFEKGALDCHLAQLHKWSIETMCEKSAEEISGGSVILIFEHKRPNFFC